MFYICFRHYFQSYAEPLSQSVFATQNKSWAFLCMRFVPFQIAASWGLLVFCNTGKQSRWASWKPVLTGDTQLTQLGYWSHPVSLIPLVFSSVQNLSEEQRESCCPHRQGHFGCKACDFLTPVQHILIRWETVCPWASCCSGLLLSALKIPWGYLPRKELCILHLRAGLPPSACSDLLS